MSVTGTPVTPASATIDVTTLARVKATIGGQMPSDTSFDSTLAVMIQSCSINFQAYLDRLITLTTRMQKFDVDPFQQAFFVKAYPIQSITDIRHDWNRAFGSDTIVSSSNYTFDAETGRVRVDRLALITGDQLLQVNYIGGMAANTTDFIASYGDLAEAADMQIAFWFQRNKTLGSEGGSSAQGGSGSLSSVDLLPEVKNRLDPYRFMGSKL